MRTAVVGHVEWIDFMRVDHVPAVGEIVHATEGWSQPGGGGANAAVQLVNLAGNCSFFTALGDDELGHRMFEHLTGLGVTVHTTFRQEDTRRAVTQVDAAGERTITVIGDRLEPRAGDPLPWEDLAGTQCVYFTAGDAGALGAARRARVLVATSRVLGGLGGVQLDGLVGSATDVSETYTAGDLDPAPALVVRTDGDRGGTYESEGVSRRYPPAEVPGPIVDRYGAGDCFAAGLTFALGEGRAARDAVALAARCGAAVITGPGPFEAQLKL